jgi:RNA polymerase sigma factor (sigma-70 family)
VEPASAAVDEAASADARADLWRSVAQLPRQQRAAVVLSHFEDLPDSEIATVMGCQPVTVRGYIHRALRTLKVEMGTPPVGDLAATTHRDRS